MQKVIKWAFLAALLAGSAASAQTYDVHVNTEFDQIESIIFSGTLTFNQGSFTNVAVGDPLALGGGDFTKASVTSSSSGAEAVNLFQSIAFDSLNYALSFDINARLGSSSDVLSVSNVTFRVDDYVDFQCGHAMVTCSGTVTRVTSVPEVDPRFAAESLLLLTGGLLVLRRRREL